jgi:uncharacterized repeat protein (TIGR04076 family)
MSLKMANCKITVLKRIVNQALIDGHLEEEYKGVGLCDCFQDGQETVIEDYAKVPDGFCTSAWADIRQDVLTVAMGANLPGIRQPATVITGPGDWFRPVIFEVERMNSV